ncbi:hypothetical protein OSC27_02050 [Microbacterium sp. STN6]|uniref:polysaccharide deacetylase WbmS family protein n=1 Tax=Microbacterium sp. STN6 TaxID=2995588 RepID=UPI002260DB0B|nr:hypothetical protein [Microbacterium sp. STN6]MCX7521055.1 hypothetical protein [Microbacterium sp. STN6]
MARQFEFTFPWGEFHTQRFFCLTADQDWAPEWATDYFLSWVQSLRLPVHVFQTNPSAILDAAAAAPGLSRGWHPNFLAGSSHGADAAEVVAGLTVSLPPADSFRSHGFGESFVALVELAKAGFVTDSQHPSAFSAHIVPAVHATGVVRIPVWFEDDIWMRLPDDRRAGLAALLPGLESPGLKVLNLHPVHIALNSPGHDFYESVRSRLYMDEDGDPRNELAFGGWGVRDLVEEIVDLVRESGDEFFDFGAIAARAQRYAQVNGSRALTL